MRIQIRAITFLVELFIIKESNNGWYLIFKLYKDITWLKETSQNLVKKHEIIVGVYVCFLLSGLADLSLSIFLCDSSHNNYLNYWPDLTKN